MMQARIDDNNWRRQGEINAPKQTLCLIFPLVVLALVGCLQPTSLLASEQQRPSALTIEALQATANESSGFADHYDAAVWMVAMDQRLARYIKDPEIRLRLLTAAHREASRHELDPQLVLAVMHVESLFDHYAVSRVGAQGVMQIMPFWKKELNEPDANLFDLETNVRFGCLILKTYLNIEKGNQFRALGRYNGSLGKAKYPDKVFNRLQRFWRF